MCDQPEISCCMSGTDIYLFFNFHASGADIPIELFSRSSQSFTTGVTSHPVCEMVLIKKFLQLIGQSVIDPHH